MTSKKPPINKPATRRPAKKPAAKKPASKRSTPVKKAVKKPAPKKKPATAKVGDKKRSNSGQFQKGNAGNGGRKAGTPNKITTELKDGIMQAFNDQGGVAYLNTLALKRPDLFVALLKAIIPAEIKATLEHKGDVTYVMHTGATNRPPIGVNNPDLKLVRDE